MNPVTPHLEVMKNETNTAIVGLDLCPKVTLTSGLISVLVEFIVFKHKTI